MKQANPKQLSQPPLPQPLPLTHTFPIPAPFSPQPHPVPLSHSAFLSVAHRLPVTDSKTVSVILQNHICPVVSCRVQQSFPPLTCLLSLPPPLCLLLFPLHRMHLVPCRSLPFPWSAPLAPAAALLLLSQAVLPLPPANLGATARAAATRAPAAKKLAVRSVIFRLHHLFSE